MVSLNQLHDFCEWGDERVYILMAITRQNENEGMTANDREVHRTVIREREDLVDNIEKLRQFYGDEDLTYRLYLSINARNVQDALFELRSQMDDWLSMRLSGHEGVYQNFKKVDSEFKSVLQTPECKDDRFFIFDCDETNPAYVDEVREHLGEQILLEAETPNGWHFVTPPHEYKGKFAPVVELKRDGMIFVDYL